jgi:hypothetical protein
MFGVGATSVLYTIDVSVRQQLEHRHPLPDSLDLELGFFRAPTVRNDCLGRSILHHDCSRPLETDAWPLERCPMLKSIHGFRTRTYRKGLQGNFRCVRAFA